MSEVLLVMAIIGILAAISFPKLGAMIRDRRVNRVAVDMMSFLRQAKTRALGRGAATVVRWTTGGSSGAGLLEMREAVVNSTPNGAVIENALPVSSCTATNWTNAFQGASGSRPVRSYPLGPSDATQFGIYEFQGPDLATQAAFTLQASVELCFTPRGRTFIRYGGAGVWTPLNSVPRIDVKNAQAVAAGGGITRAILIPPNGMSRLAI